MARPPKTIEVPDLHDESINQKAVASAMVALQVQTEHASALALHIGYEGALTVGALEDGIRFYQRRSVEALLEVGKRLLLLKEVTPHGEFAERIQELGFAKTTAFRFMQAAAKTAKSSNLGLLATQVKSTSAFLELVTHDDDADLERLAEMDDIERMSASQVRAALRESRAEHAATQTIADKRQERIDKLERDVLRVQNETADERFIGLQKEATGIAADAQGAVLGGLRQALLALRKHADLHGIAAGEYDTFMAGLVGQVQAQLSAVRDEFNLPDISCAADAQLAAEVAQWAQ